MLYLGNTPTALDTMVVSVSGDVWDKRVRLGRISSEKRSRGALEVTNVIVQKCHIEAAFCTYRRSCRLFRDSYADISCGCRAVQIIHCTSPCLKSTSPSALNLEPLEVSAYLTSKTIALCVIPACMKTNHAGAGPQKSEIMSCEAAMVSFAGRGAGRSPRGA